MANKQDRFSRLLANKGRQADPERAALMIGEVLNVKPESMPDDIRQAYEAAKAKDGETVERVQEPAAAQPEEIAVEAIVEQEEKKEEPAPDIEEEQNKQIEKRQRRPKQLSLAEAILKDSSTYGSIDGRKPTKDGFYMYNWKADYEMACKLRDAKRISGQTYAYILDEVIRHGFKELERTGFFDGQILNERVGK